MKPEIGGESTRNEMAQEEFDPLDLMSGLAMLVLEARTPDNSVKGRVEGPHCPSFKKGGRHLCSKETLECLRALEFRERINLMWKNGIPSCIDILLFPACSHGKDEARSLEGVGSAHVRENSILLERWSIRCIQKWHGEWSEGVSGSMLLQAVRSYLYFSQLSSWLTSMHGCLPVTIVYRLYAPGEEAGVDFAQPPDSHAFPTGIYGPHGLKAHVLALPRQEHVPALLCALAGDQEAAAESGLGVAGACGEGRVAEDGVEEVGQLGDSWPSRSVAADYHLDKSQPAEYDGRQTKTFDLLSSCEFSNTSTYPHVASARDPSELTQLCGEPPMVTVYEAAGAFAGGAKVKSQRSSSRDRLEGQLRPLELSADGPGSRQPLDLHSPKVLMSAEAKVPNALVTKKQHIDFRHPDRRQTDDRYPTFDSMEEKLFLARHFRDLPSPLSPLDIQNFLANLQSLSGPIPQPINLPASLADGILARKTSRALEDGKREDLGGEDLGFNPLVHAATGTGGCMHKGVKPKGSRSLTTKQLSPLQDSSVSAAQPKDGKYSQRSERPADNSDADAHNLLSKLPWKVGKSQFQRNAALANLLLRSHDGAGLKKKDLIVAAQQWSESQGEDGDVGRKTDGVTEPQAVKKRKALGLGDFDERVTSNCASDMGLSISIDQTLRDINKIVRARKTKSIDHEFPEAQPSNNVLSMGNVVSSSWSSSSSSSSSSTCSSSSPRVLRGLLDDGDRNSGSSTPTNRCTPPLSQHSRDLSPHRRKSDSMTTSRLTLTEIVETVTPDNRRPLASETKSDSNGHVPASHDAGTCSFESDLTPEAVNGALPDEPAKRRLAFDICTTPVPFSHGVYVDSISQTRIQTTDKSKSPDASNAKSRNIPPSWNLQSLHREVLALEEESAGLPQPSQDLCEKQCATASEQYSSSSALEICDQTKSAPDPTSLCKFYLENSPSPSLSVTSFTNGAAYTPSLSEQNNCRVSDDSLIQNWQQTLVETPFSDQSNSKLYDRPEKSAQPCSTHSVRTLDSLRDGPSPFDLTSAHTNGFTANKAVKKISIHISQNSTTVSHHNGAVQNDEDASYDDNNTDGVFSDEEEPYQDRKRHVPTRAKSAPNFFNASTKSRVPREAENGSTDGCTRGRLPIREKPQIGLAKGAGPQERLRHRLVKSASMMFSSRSGLPSQSSPAPIKRRSTERFDYDESLTSAKAIKSALSMPRLPHVSQYSTDDKSESGRILSTSAPASTNSLLGNFEESILNGRIEPAGVVDGFTVDVGASGSFCPRHLSLPVTAYFFHLSDDNAPSPYLGHISLDEINKKGYHIPRKGTLQVTLFNPNKTVVKMFVVMYDLVDMPPDSQTVIRQRTVYMPVEPDTDEPSYLRYLIHLRVASSPSGKIYLHTDIRLIFARNKFELDSNVAKYELRSFTETPVNPKYSPKR